nr:5-(carboxyamino)imidazole ribonucleotide synthase [Atopococcus tabaci]
MNKTIYPSQTIGILGAGQLGKMLGQSAQKMGYRVAMYDKGTEACGFGVSHFSKIGSFDDKDNVMEFARSVDVLTYEFENINGEILQELNTHTRLPQGASFLLTTQHRVQEKTWLNEQGIPTTRFSAVGNKDELKTALDRFGFPAVLKTTRFGYDGKGQLRLNTPTDLEEKAEEVADLLQAECILEAFCSFEYEASIVVARDAHGTVTCFPPAVNHHRAGILSASLTPGCLSQTVMERMQTAAEKVAEAAELIGVCGIEFFVTAEEDVLVNELAPRPHNTGHYTIEGCNVSQFDQHILAVAGRPLMPVRLLTPTLMVNILGQHMDHVPELMRRFPDAVVHLYDKGEPKHQRKMGHFTLTDPSAERLEQLLESDPFLNEWLDAIG